MGLQIAPISALNGNWTIFINRKRTHTLTHAHRECFLVLTYFRGTRKLDFKAELQIIRKWCICSFFCYHSVILIKLYGNVFHLSNAPLRTNFGNADFRVRLSHLLTHMHILSYRFCTPAGISCTGLTVSCNWTKQQLTGKFIVFYYLKLLHFKAVQYLWQSWFGLCGFVLVLDLVSTHARTHWCRQAASCSRSPQSKGFWGGNSSKNHQIFANTYTLIMVLYCH